MIVNPDFAELILEWFNAQFVNFQIVKESDLIRLDEYHVTRGDVIRSIHFLNIFDLLKYVQTKELLSIVE